MVRQGVPSVHQEVGPQVGEPGQPALLGVLARGHVQVGDVQDAYRRFADRQHGQGGLAQRPAVELDTGGIGRPSDGQCGGS